MPPLEGRSGMSCSNRCRTVNYNSSGTSAEAIHERPTVGASFENGATNIAFNPDKITITALGHPTRPWPVLVTAVTKVSLH
jgi:hypothetical protein